MYCLVSKSSAMYFFVPCFCSNSSDNFLFLKWELCPQLLEYLVRVQVCEKTHHKSFFTGLELVWSHFLWRLQVARPYPPRDNKQWS